MSHLVGYDVSDYIKGRDDVFIYGMRSVYLLAAAVCGIGAFLTAVRLFDQKRKRHTSVNLETN
jgi:hypothetical protein